MPALFNNYFASVQALFRPINFFLTFTHSHADIQRHICISPQSYICMYYHLTTIVYIYMYHHLPTIMYIYATSCVRHVIPPLDLEVTSTDVFKLMILTAAGFGY